MTTLGLYGGQNISCKVSSLWVIKYVLCVLFYCFVYILLDCIDFFCLLFIPAVLCIPYSGTVGVELSQCCWTCTMKIKVYSILLFYDLNQSKIFLILSVRRIRISNLKMFKTFVYFISVVVVIAVVVEIFHWNTQKSCLQSGQKEKSVP